MKTLYKILLKHQNPKNVNNNIWHSYGTTTTSTSTYASSTTSFKEFETDDLEVLKEKIKELDKEYGHNDIRVINDVTYEVMVEIEESIDSDDLEIVTSSDIKNIYNTAYANVFYD